MYFKCWRNVHEKINDTDNLLTYAISCQKPDVVDLLLSNGARPLPNQFGVIDIDAFYKWVTPYGPEMLTLAKTHLNPIYKPEEDISTSNSLQSWIANNKKTLTSIGSLSMIALVSTYVYKKRSKKTQEN